MLISRRTTTPMFAAMVNAAASHVAEKDDVHNGSVFHPGAVVFPAALAIAQPIDASGRDLLTAAAAAAGHLKLTSDQMLHAFGSAGTQAAGLWEFMGDAADSTQLHTAAAAANGLTSAYLAQDGFTGARRIRERAQGMAAGVSSDADPARLTDRLGERWALAETSFKFHASCRHMHPGADALQQVMRTHGLQPEQLTRVAAHVHQGAIDVPGAVVDPQTVHQARFPMGMVPGLIAHYDVAGLSQFEDSFNAAPIAAFRGKVGMKFDDEVDTAYPARWIGKVTVETTDGRRLTGRVGEPKGDPGNALSCAELGQKALRLALFGEAASEAEMHALAERVWHLADAPRVANLFAREDLLQS